MQTHNFARATLYLNAAFGVQTYRVRDVTVEVGVRYAQYPNAVRVTYVEKGKRRKRAIVQTSCPSLVVVDGWDAPAYDPHTMVDLGGGCARTRLASFDAGWQREFDAWLAATAVPVALDFRQHDAARAA